MDRERGSKQGSELESYVFSNFFLFKYFLANFEKPVLGCITADFCKQILNTRLEALDEIYKIPL